MRADAGRADAITDVTADVIDLDLSWGAGEWMGPLTLAEAGAATITFYDPDRVLDPGNTTLAYPVVPGRLDASNGRRHAGVDRHRSGRSRTTSPPKSRRSTSRRRAGACRVGGIGRPRGRTGIRPSDGAPGRLGMAAGALPRGGHQLGIARGRAVHRQPRRRPTPARGCRAGCRSSWIGPAWSCTGADRRTPPDTIEATLGDRAIGIVNLANAIDRRIINTIVVDMGASVPARKYQDDRACARTASPRSRPWRRTWARSVMATLTIRANKSSAFLQRESDGLNVAAGQDDHMPVASSWAGHKERSACSWSISSSVWDGMGSVEQVQLVLRSTGAGVHVGRGSSPKCTVRRITETWTPNGATMDGGGSATNAGLVYPGPSIDEHGRQGRDVSGLRWRPGRNGGDHADRRAWMPTRLGGTGGSCNGVLLVQTSNAADISEFYSAEVSTDSWRPTLVITYTPLGSSVPASPTSSRRWGSWCRRRAFI